MEPILEGTLVRSFESLRRKGKTTYTVSYLHLADYPKENPCEILACMRALDVSECEEARSQ